MNNTHEALTALYEDTLSAAREIPTMQTSVWMHGEGDGRLTTLTQLIALGDETAVTEATEVYQSIRTYNDLEKASRLGALATAAYQAGLVEAGHSFYDKIPFRDMHIDTIISRATACEDEIATLAPVITSRNRAYGDLYLRSIARSYIEREQYDAALEACDAMTGGSGYTNPKFEVLLDVIRATGDTELLPEAREAALDIRDLRKLPACHADAQVTALTKVFKCGDMDSLVLAKEIALREAHYVRLKLLAKIGQAARKALIEGED